MRSVSERCNFTVFQQPDSPRYNARSVADIASSQGQLGIVCALDLVHIPEDRVR